ncbi:MAG: hypothetical protein H0W62_09130 [Chitinophagales bacterium]|nr:hypothetical protein [Chitinophagales bacterium]
MRFMKKVFIGTVGYHNLSNHSIGSALLPKLQKMNWGKGVEVDELNWGPIAIVQKFQSLPTQYDRVILLSAIERPGRKIGDITVFKWKGKLPDEELIQRCIGDAVTGVISVENLLIIGEYFKIWTGETFFVDVEPGAEEAGESFTEEMLQAVPLVIETLQQLSNTESAELINFKPLFGDTLIEANA